MDNKKYVKSVVLRENKDYDGIGKRLANVSDQRLLHAMIGMCTEVGEFQDMMKKHMIYGKDIDRVNLKEELGDVLWYVALAIDELGTSFEEVMEINNAKLAAHDRDWETRSMSFP